MATTAQREREQRARRAAAAATAAGAAAAAGTAPPALVAPEVAAAAASHVTANFVRFLAAAHLAGAAFLRRFLSRRTGNVDMIERVIRQEQRLGEEFDRKAAERMVRDLPRVLAIPDARQRERALERLNDREKRYAQQRSDAMALRAHNVIERTLLKQISPLGALWEIGAAEEHTAGCLFMHGKFWPWEVLDRVHPPRHLGCTSKLRGYGEAVALGLMDPGGVPDTATAIRMAAAVIMEEDEETGRALLALVEEAD